MIKNSQKGVSLIIAFFVMITMIAVVVSLSILLYGQIKILGNTSNAVSAFYLADGGIEKTLYYDRKEMVGEIRGMCNICTETDGVKVCPDCICDLEPTGTDCEPDSCTDCNIKFTTPIEDSEKYYSLDITVNQQCKASSGSMNSYGFYENLSRAIMVSLNTKATVGVVPTIGGQVCSPDGVAGYKIEADISDDDLSDGDEETEIEVFALITGYGDENVPGPKCTVACTAPFPTNKCCYREIKMEPSFTGSTHYTSNPWNYYISTAEYTIKIMATDSAGNCLEVTACTITNY